MISVEEAKQCILNSTEALSSVDLSLSNCLERVLADDVISPIHYPPFHQSAMDGFAIRHDDYLNKKEIQLIGEAPAGKPFTEILNPGAAVRIFTGSKLPEGADTVVIQEKVFCNGRKLEIQDLALVKGANIRTMSSLIRKGVSVLQKGTVLNAGAIGFLSGLGLTQVAVYSKPTVSILVTGDELTRPGDQLRDGQIYESNSVTLIAALQSVYLEAKEIVFVGDDSEKTKQVLKAAIENSDIVLISGGISVGKYDFVSSALEAAGVKEIFHKVSQKPGKPLFFGKHKQCLVFGLPGNPASVLTSFYEYVLLGLNLLQGNTDPFLKNCTLRISKGFQKKEGLSFFLKGKIQKDYVEVLEGQASNDIGAFASADCLIYLPAQLTEIMAGEPVEVHLLP